MVEILVPLSDPDCPLSFLCNGTQSFVSPALLARGLNKCANVDHNVHLSFPMASDRRQEYISHPSAISGTSTLWPWIHM